MSFLEWYGFAAPAILAAFGAVIYVITGWDHRRTLKRIEQMKRHPS